MTIDVKQQGLNPLGQAFYIYSLIYDKKELVNFHKAGIKLYLINHLLTS